jgi:hypothetical protein
VGLLTPLPLLRWLAKWVLAPCCFTGAEPTSL